MDKRLDLLIRILGWSLIAIALGLLFLKVIGVLSSPEIEFVSLLMTSGVFITVGYLTSKTSTVLSELAILKGELARLKGSFTKLEAKFELIWKDFERRKKI